MPIRGCSYVFLDEVLFAGDRKAADGLKKSLSTCTEIGDRDEESADRQMPDRGQPVASEATTPPPPISKSMTGDTGFTARQRAPGRRRRVFLRRSRRRSTMAAGRPSRTTS